MGKRSFASYDDSYLFFECASPRVSGSDKAPVRILGSLVYTKKPDTDSRDRRENNLTVLHAASLAVAKKMECADDAGLPAKADLRERKPSTAPAP
ncbi:hypothetical protein [Streptomyces sp. NPDC091212]|uniref:hypothetical protein n=1 Tax=Streptomyces sp. NPDC091212 TaxID=3155191 RepID=UPI003449396A